ncbi:phosphatases II [Cystobasidium minutum MCA 4210]|uniref:phosphatases II n=1 Tax=Cystobasidium minutum MCA 4210 TaxID=1397322 RepID=UPI0034CF5219|eukprot:jgi/Rhomi1/82669/CE82668_486
MPSHPLPAPLAAFHASPQYKTQVQDLLSRREAQRRTIAHSDPEKLRKVSLDVLPQKARDAFNASHANDGLNAMRNRYSDIVPYDATRVLLGGQSPENSYINASYIREPSKASTAKSARTWIASQAPTRETVHDFLSLFLKVPEAPSSPSLLPTPPRVILMLTACRESGREKSARYWPSSVGETIKVQHRTPVVVSPAASRYVRPEVEWRDGPDPPIQVTFVSSKPSSNADEKRDIGWRTNELLLLSGDRKTTIYQIEYLGWQDHGVPDSPEEVLDLLKHVNALLDKTSAQDSPGSLVTHCSAGVGRTGSFIAIAWLASILEDLIPHDQTRLEVLREQAQQSPLGPLPAIPIPSSAGNVGEKARGLLPSFLHKNDHQIKNNGTTDATSKSTLEDFDFVMATIDNLRDQRTTMVQTSSQVAFVYEVAKTWWARNAK